MITYKEFGNKNGKPVVFIHGGFTSSESYQKQYELLPECHSIFVDLPCFGNSNQYEHFSFEEAADCVMELIDKVVGNKKVILIAHSYGGLVAKLLLEMRPQIIEKMVIGSTNIRKTPLYRMYTSRVGCWMLYQLNQKRFEKEHISKRLVYEMQKSAWENFRKCKKTDSLSVLLLVAQKDIRDIKKSMEEWEYSMTNSTIVTIEDSGHNYFWDKPYEVNRLLRNFCLGLDNE